jgi:hypothetical protein
LAICAHPNTQKYTNNEALETKQGKGTQWSLLLERIEILRNLPLEVPQGWGGG